MTRITWPVSPLGGAVHADEARRWERMAHNTVNELLARETEPVLTDDQAKAVWSIVAEAEAQLKESGISMGKAV